MSGPKKIIFIKSAEWLLDYFWPQRKFESDPEKIAATTIFLYTNIFMHIVRWPLTLVHLFEDGPMEVLAPASLIYASCLTASLIWFKRSQAFFGPAQIMLFSFSGYYLYGMYWTGGIHSPFLLSFPLAMAFAFAVLPRFWSSFWSLLAAIGIISLFIFEKLNILPPDIFSPPEADYYFLIYVLLLLIILFWLFEIFKRVFISYRNHIENQRLESSHLLQTLSHDLRSPLQIIQSYNQIFDSSNPTKVLEYRRHIERSVERIALILNRLREYEKLLRERKTLELVPIDLKHHLQEMVDIVSDDFIDKNIKVSLTWEPPTDQFVVWGDPIAFSEQVLGNFLSNAFKFSETGSLIEIHIKKQGTKIKLSIRDYGIGMPSQTVSNLFNFQKSSSRIGTAGERGSGFGMPIAKFFLDQMKIDFNVESWTEDTAQEKRGTLISLVLLAAP